MLQLKNKAKEQQQKYTGFFSSGTLWWDINSSYQNLLFLYL